MARISNYMSDRVDAPSVKVDSDGIRIVAGEFWLTVSIAERDQLITDLLATKEAVPVEQGEAA
jgi:hypothetical protein